MTDHPITPPPELKEQWREIALRDCQDKAVRDHWLMNRAAQWSADQELEACIAWMIKMGYWGEDGQAIPLLRAARRPKPPSLKEQALKEMDKLDEQWEVLPIELDSLDIIRRALEALPDDE